MPAQHPEQDESYFISMTDLMVGMLFIFIILLMAFALNLKEQETKLKAQETKLTQTDTARTKMLRDIETSLKKKGIPVVVLPESGVLRLPEQVLFDIGRADLQPQGALAVSKLGEALQEVLPCYAGPITPAACSTRAFGRLESVFIEGHTDNQPIAGIADGNWQLSYARARAVYRELTQRDSLIEVLRNDKDGQKGAGEKLLGISGYADQRPAESNDSPAGQQANRRIDLRFIMAIPDLERQSQLDEIIVPAVNGQ